MNNIKDLEYESKKNFYTSDINENKHIPINENESPESDIEGILFCQYLIVRYR